MRLRRRTGAVATAGFLSAAAVVVGVWRSGLENAALLAVLRGFTVASVVSVGCLIWWQRPRDRFGPLLAALGFAFALTALTASSDPEVFTAGRAFTAGMWVLLAYVFLSLPHGLIESPRDRRVVRWLAGATVAVWIPLLLFGDKAPRGGPFVRCAGECPDNPFDVADPGSAVSTVIEVLAAALPILGLLAVAIALARRIDHVGALQRRTLGPPLIVMCGLIVGGAPYAGLREAGVDGAAVEAFGVLCIACSLALPWSLLLGMLRGRMFVGAAAQSLLVRLGAEQPTPARVRTVLADTLGDPTVELAYWLPDRSCYVDEWGKVVDIPPTEPGRATTRVGSDGEPLAAIVHDPALKEHPELLEAAAAAAELSLKNTRLEAELRASIRDLRESRRRLASAADAERRRLERDIHDGAQQRLIALQVRLGLAADLVDQHNDEAAAQMIAKLSGDAQAALENLRELVRGIYPPLLTDRGLTEVLGSVARDAPLPVVIHAEDVGRCSPETEAAVYFCCVEAIQNATKHAGPDAHVAISLERRNGDLTFAVTDDGRGFDQQGRLGDGLRNMRDRISAVGGELEIDSGAGRGTRVHGRIRVGASSTVG